MQRSRKGLDLAVNDGFGNGDKGPAEGNQPASGALLGGFLETKISGCH